MFLIENLKYKARTRPYDSHTNYTLKTTHMTDAPLQKVINILNKNINHTQIS